jgi:hypothetical protein
LEESVYSALFHSRMRIPADRREWVIELIGPERAYRCPSIGLRRKE